MLRLDAALHASGALKSALAKLDPDTREMHKTTFKREAGSRALALPDHLVKMFAPVADLDEDAALVLMLGHRRFGSFHLLSPHEKVRALRHICTHSPPDMGVPGGRLLSPEAKRAYSAAILEGVMRSLDDIALVLHLEDAAHAHAMMEALLRTSMVSDGGAPWPDSTYPYSGTLYGYMQPAWDQHCRYVVAAAEVLSELERAAATLGSLPVLPPCLLSSVLVACGR